MQYDLSSEYKVDIKSEEVQELTDACRRMFLSYSEDLRTDFDLAVLDSIPYVCEEAERRGLFDLAQQVRESIFGRDVHFYGVSYLWDHCVNQCPYCPGSVPNRSRSGYESRELSVEEAIEDTLAVMSDGHTHICYLTGEDPKVHPPERLAEYLLEFDKLGLDEIILNIPPLSTEGFKILRDAVQRTPLQFRVFQETYDRNTYARLHPGGPKGDYDFRLESQARALDAGFDNVGIGVLFGLHRFPLEEILGLMEHAQSLKESHDIDPIRVCLPTANFLPNIGVHIPYVLEKGTYDDGGNLVEASYYELFDELIYALAKLAMPHLSLVSSERDPKGLLRILDKYATCTVLNVHPGVGDNIRHHKGIMTDEVHFEQATSFSRDPEETLKDMRARGFVPILRGAN